MRLPGSLRARLTLAALLAVAIGGADRGPAAARRGRARRPPGDRPRAAPADRRGAARRAGAGAGRRPLRRAARAAGQRAAARLGQLRAGRLRRRGRRARGRRARPRARAAASARASRRSRSTGRAWRSLTIALGGPADARFQVLSTLAPVEERVASTRRLIVLIGLLALALTGLAAWFFSSLAVRPLARLQAGAARVTGAEDLSTPLPDEGPDEVRSLAGTLNGMLARLQASTAATRRFAADAGHELRTPLTSLRANLDALARNPDLPEAERAALLRESSAEQDRIVHLLEGLQALARGEAARGAPARGRRARRPRRRRGLRRPPPPSRRGVRAARARRGGRHAPRLGQRAAAASSTTCSTTPRCTAAGRVDVDLAREDGGWLLRVADDGPGIPDGRARAGARAVRPRTRRRPRQGTGLGPGDRRPAGRAARRRAAAGGLRARRPGRRGAAPGRRLTTRLPVSPLPERAPAG